MKPPSPPRRLIHFVSVKYNVTFNSLTILYQFVKLNCIFLPKDPPGPPKNLHHVDADKTEVWLQWEWPDRTGGSEITGFIVEHQEEGATDWVTFKTVSNPQCHVSGLMEGKTYRFRVKSQNAIGISRPDTSVPITCQEKTCKAYTILYLKITDNILNCIMLNVN